MAFTFSMIMLWFSYGTATLVGDTIPPVFFYCIAVVLIREKALVASSAESYPSNLSEAGYSA